MMGLECSLELVSKFFFRMMGLECNFSFRSLECNSYLRKSYHRKLGLECSFSFRSSEYKSSFRKLGLEYSCDLRKFYHHRSCHRMEHIRFFFVGLGRSQFSFV